MIPTIVPNPLNTLTEFDRYYHYDLINAETGDLLDELYALRPLLWGLSKTDWIRQRVTEIEAEITRRKYGDSQSPRQKARPKRLAEGVRL